MIFGNFKSKGGGSYKALGIPTHPHCDHRSTGISRRQGNGIFAHPERGHIDDCNRRLANPAGPGAADLPATKAQKPERRTGEIGWISFC